MTRQHGWIPGRDRNRALWHGLAFGTLAFVGACGAAMTQAHHYGSDVLSRFQYAGAGRDFTTVIVGNPFSVPQETLERTVTDAMQDRPAPSPTSRPSHRITRGASSAWS